MAEAAIVAIGEAVFDALVVAGIDAITFSAIVDAAVIATTVAYSQQQQARARRRARDQYNAALEDRTLTVRNATAPRRIVLGRARVGGVLQYVATTGANKETLAMVLALAGHEIDAVETVYFNDVPVTLDGSGYVQTAPYAIDKRVADSADIAVVAGIGSVTLPHAPVAGSVSVTYYDSVNQTWTPMTFSVAGSDVSTTAPTSITGTARVQYDYLVTESKARVIAHLGSDTQTVDTVLNALLPTEWSSTHRGRGIAYLVCLFTYDPDAYPSGLPNVSAVVRGLKCYDPRSGLTQWSENPAICARAYAIHALGGRLDASAMIDSQITTAANVCDTAVTYTVGGVSTSRALYTCGTMADTAAKPIDVLSELAQAMAGKVAFVGNQMHIRAGAYVAPVLSLGDDDFAVVSVNGAPQSTPVSIQPKTPREQLFNIVTGRFSDPDNGWQVVDMPRVTSSTYITEDGAELPLDVQFNAVTHAGQAQQLAAVMMRQARQALTLQATFKLTAYAVELFDTVSITSSRFGWSSKVFEVLGRRWSLTGGIELTLRETDASVYTLGLSFDAVDAAPNTLLPSPWTVPAVAGLTLASGATWMYRGADGIVYPRLHVSWTAQTDAAVLQHGAVEIRYGLANTAESTWTSIEVPGGDSSVNISGLTDGAVYVVKARARNAIAKGQWCAQKTHQLTGGQSTLDWSGIDGWMGDPGSFFDGFESATALDRWTGYSGSGELSLVSVSDAGSGAAVLRVGDNSGNDQAWLIHDANIAFDPTALYRIKSRIRRTAGTGTVYVGLAGVAADGTSFVNRSGSNSYSNQHYFAAAGAAPGSSWTEYTGYVRGTAASGTGGSAVTDPNAPGVMHEDVRYIRPLVIVNYSGAAGTTEVDFVSVERLGGQIGTGDLGDDAATELLTDVYDFAGGSYGTATARTVNFTPVSDCRIELTATLEAARVDGDAAHYVSWYVSAGGGADTLVGDFPGNDATTTRILYTAVADYAATGGVALAFKLKTSRPAFDPDILLYASTLRLTAVKK